MRPPSIACWHVSAVATRRLHLSGWCCDPTCTGGAEGGMELYLLGLSLPLYLLATAGLVVYLMVAHETARRFALAALGGGFVLHLCALIARALATGSVAMNAFHDQLSLFAWLT